MKLHFKLVTNRKVPIDVNFQQNTEPSTATMSVTEHSEQMLEVDYKVFSNSDPFLFKKNLKRVILRNYKDVTSIECVSGTNELLGRW